eukprot:4341171-Prymnesium_polylepis.1
MVVGSGLSAQYGCAVVASQSGEWTLTDRWPHGGLCVAMCLRGDVYLHCSTRRSPLDIVMPPLCHERSRTSASSRRQPACASSRAHLRTPTRPAAIFERKEETQLPPLGSR